MQHQEATLPALQLPERLVTVVDLNRAIRELKHLDDWLNQASLRSPGQPVAAPKTSVTLEDLARVNNISLLEATQRQNLILLADQFSLKVPKIHMSFAVEPSANFLLQMIQWMRANIHPQALLEIGLQPTLAAGCTVRTVNKMFDLSLRHRFIDSRDKLVQSIAAVEGLTVDSAPNAVEQPAVTAEQAVIGTAEALADTDGAGEASVTPIADTSQANVAELSAPESIPDGSQVTATESGDDDQIPALTPELSIPSEVTTEDVTKPEVAS